MKKTGIINSDLAHAIASMGHTDLMLVVDAGFPIPRSAWRVDLALTPGSPSTEEVLTAIAGELIVERTIVADDVPEMNPPLNNLVHDLFQSAEHDTAAHADILGEMAQEAKVIVRTGAFNPWGNIVLVSGVDAPNWFNKEGVGVPDEYAKRIERMLAEEGK